jgi:superfamily II DNA or RNA helicase
MHIIIKTPIKAYLLNYTSDELINIRKQLTFTNTSIAFNIKKLHGQRWFKKNNPEAFAARLKELESAKKQTLVFEDSEGIYIRPGSITYLENILYTVENQVYYPPYKPILWKHKPDFEPYPYQQICNDGLIDNKHGNISCATGTGKTFIIEMITRNMGLPTVIVTPSQAIFDQLYNESIERFGSRLVGGYGDGYKDIDKKITIAISKSLTNLEKGTEAYDHFHSKQLMLIDECHSFASKTLEDVCHGVFEDVPYRMFVSATVQRGDGSSKLLYSIVGPTVFRLSVKDAIAQGYLCPFKFKILPCITPSTREKKDPIENKREHLLHNKSIAELAAKIANSMALVKNESTLILVEELSQIKSIIQLLKVPYTYVHAESSKKKLLEIGLEKVNKQDEVERFNCGKVKVLVGTSCISCGVNIYPTHHVINWAGGASEIDTFQGPMGRATRKLEISKYAQFHNPKPFSTIYDFRVIGQDILERHLQKRIECYESTGEKVQIF